MPLWKDVPEVIQKRFPAPPERAAYPNEKAFEEALGSWQGRIGRNIGFVMQSLQAKCPHKKLLFRVVPHNDGMVFAEPSRAKQIAQLHQAISGSKTWAEFRKAVPASEYKEIMQSAFDKLGEKRPKGSDAFSGEAIPGWSDGDYPAWLQKELHLVMPMEILSQFGRHEQTAVNGRYWHIPGESLQAICDMLNAVGVETKRADDLRFY